MQAPSNILNQLNSLYVNQGLEMRRGEALGARLVTRLHDDPLSPFARMYLKINRIPRRPFNRRGSPSLTCLRTCRVVIRCVRLTAALWRQSTSRLLVPFSSRARTFRLPTSHRVACSREATLHARLLIAMSLVSLTARDQFGTMGKQCNWLCLTAWVSRSPEALPKAELALAKNHRPCGAPAGSLREVTTGDAVG
jgi:hypothetical protein